MTTKKVLLIIFGGLSTLIGVGLAVVGIVVVLVVGSGDGFFDSSSTSLSSPGYALVSEAAGANERGIEATARVAVTPQDGKAVFVGVAPPEVVQDYLGPAAYTELSDVDFSPLAFRTTQHDGGAPDGPPGSRPDWLRQVSGSGEQVLTFDLLTPQYRVVVMNADGSQGVDVSLRLGLRMPLIRTIGIGVLVAAAVFLLVGILLLVWGVKAKGKQKPPVEPDYAMQGTQGYGYPPGAGYPPQGWQPPSGSQPAPPPEEDPQR